MVLSHYDVLSVAPDASNNEIKAAYRRKILETHPDKLVAERDGKKDGEITTQRGNSSKLLTSVGAIQEAYRVLADPASRSEYDTLLLEKVKQTGLVLSGDGLDVYGLEEFGEQESEGAILWIKTCPRCEAENAMCLTEDNLEEGTEDGEGGLEVAVQCLRCSLWIKVRYTEAEE